MTDTFIGNVSGDGPAPAFPDASAADTAETAGTAEWEGAGVDEWDHSEPGVGPLGFGEGQPEGQGQEAQEAQEAREAREAQEPPGRRDVIRHRQTFRSPGILPIISVIGLGLLGMTVIGGRGGGATEAEIPPSDPAPGAGQRNVPVGDSGVTVPEPVGVEAVNNLPVQVQIVVPSTIGNDPISQDVFEERIDSVRRWMADKYDGTTSVKASGEYVGDDSVISEPVSVVESSMSIGTYRRYLDDLGQFIRRMQREWEQDTVFYSVEGRDFIYPERHYIDDDSEIPEWDIEVS